MLSKHFGYAITPTKCVLQIVQLKGFQCSIKLKCKIICSAILCIAFHFMRIHTWKLPDSATIMWSEHLMVHNVPVEIAFEMCHSNASKHFCKCQSFRVIWNRYELDGIICRCGAMSFKWLHKSNRHILLHAFSPCFVKNLIKIGVRLHSIEFPFIVGCCNGDVMKTNKTTGNYPSGSGWICV